MLRPVAVAVRTLECSSGAVDVFDGIHVDEGVGAGTGEGDRESVPGVVLEGEAGIDGAEGDTVPLQAEAVGVEDACTQGEAADGIGRFPGEAAVAEGLAHRSCRKVRLRRGRCLHRRRCRRSSRWRIQWRRSFEMNQLERQLELMDGGNGN